MIGRAPGAYYLSASGFGAGGSRPGATVFFCRRGRTHVMPRGCRVAGMYYYVLTR